MKRSWEKGEVGAGKPSHVVLYAENLFGDHPLGLV